jgi:hypothetical protein
MSFEGMSFEGLAITWLCHSTAGVATLGLPCPESWAGVALWRAFGMNLLVANLV